MARRREVSIGPRAAQLRWIPSNREVSRWAIQEDGDRKNKQVASNKY
jgi:hypothetical protein